MRKIVTSYIKPDIDGISSMYAYAELLRKMGYNAEYYYEGQARKEVQIVLETYGIEGNRDIIEYFSTYHFLGFNVNYKKRGIGIDGVDPRDEYIS